MIVTTDKLAEILEVTEEELIIACRNCRIPVHRRADETHFLTVGNAQRISTIYENARLQPGQAPRAIPAHLREEDRYHLPPDWQDAERESHRTI